MAKTLRIDDDRNTVSATVRKTDNQVELCLDGEPVFILDDDGDYWVYPDDIKAKMDLDHTPEQQD